MNAEQLRELLKKYMRHVLDEEGAHFVGWRDDLWSDEEWAVLDAVRSDIEAEAAADHAEWVAMIAKGGL